MIPKGLYLKAEDLRKWDADTVVPSINGFSDEMRAILSNGLRLTENFDCEVKNVTFVAQHIPWTSIPLNTGIWEAYGTTPEYRVMPGGRVELRGAVHAVFPGTGTADYSDPSGVAATMPSGTRPAQTLSFAVESGQGYVGVLHVEADGTVRCCFAGGAPAGSEVFSLDSVSYQAGPQAAAPAHWTTGGFPLSFETQVEKPLAVIVATAKSLTVPGETVGPAQASWSMTADKRISIRSFSGLQPGRRYTVDLLVLGG